MERTTIHAHIDLPTYGVIYIIGNSFARSINASMPALVINDYVPGTMSFDCLLGSGEALGFDFRFSDIKMAEQLRSISDIDARKVVPEVYLEKGYGMRLLRWEPVGIAFGERKPPNWAKAPNELMLTPTELKGHVNNAELIKVVDTVLKLCGLRIEKMVVERDIVDLTRENLKARF